MLETSEVGSLIKVTAQKKKIYIRFTATAMIIELYKGTTDHPYQTEQAVSAPQNAARVNHRGIYLPVSLPGLTCCMEQPGLCKAVWVIHHILCLASHADTFITTGKNLLRSPSMTLHVTLDMRFLWNNSCGIWMLIWKTSLTWAPGNPGVPGEPGEPFGPVVPSPPAKETNIL